MAWRRKVKAVLSVKGCRKIVMVRSRLIVGKRRPTRKAKTALCLAFVASLALASCGPATPTNGISDPNEAQNRAVHRFNVELDRTILRPIATSASDLVPEPVEQGVVNFASNLELPGTVVNNVLQLRLGRAVENTLRFVINTTVGIGGLFDPASQAGVMGKSSDFGETLQVWGVTEGNYFELPFLGPSTDRDALGKVVDFALDPLKLFIDSNSPVPLLAKIGSRISDRGRYSDTVDSVLYDSADSYAQTRLLYLQNRRFDLGEVPSEESFEDPYAE